MLGSNPAIIGLLTTRRDHSDINTQVAVLMHRLPRKAKANKAKKHVPSNICEGLKETRIHSNVWNNLGETARSNDLKLPRNKNILFTSLPMSFLLSVIDLNEAESQSRNDAEWCYLDEWSYLLTKKKH